MSESSPTRARHLVLFNFTPGTPEADQAMVLDTLRGLRDLPMVRDYRVLANLHPEAMAATYAWLTLAEFDDVAALRAFQDDPLHETLRPVLRRNLAESAVIDAEYATVPPDEAAPLTRHFVLFNFRDAAPPQQRDRAVAALRRLADLSMVRSYVVTPSVASARRQTHAWLCAGAFDDEASLAASEQDPVFQAIGPELLPWVTDMTRFDAAF